jgi:hypothetical protein
MSIPLTAVWPSSRSEASFRWNRAICFTAIKSTEGKSRVFSRSRKFAKGTSLGARSDCPLTTAH